MGRNEVDKEQHTIGPTAGTIIQMQEKTRHPRYQRASVQTRMQNSRNNKIYTE